MLCSEIYFPFPSFYHQVATLKDLPFHFQTLHHHWVAASGCVLPEMNGRLETLKNMFCRKMFFFKFGGWIGRILSYLTPDPDSQNHVANHIPPTSSIALGRSCGVASMVVECWKIKEKILERTIEWPQVAASGFWSKWRQVAARGLWSKCMAATCSHSSGRKWPHMAAFRDFNFHPQSNPSGNYFARIHQKFCRCIQKLVSAVFRNYIMRIEKLFVVVVRDYFVVLRDYCNTASAPLLFRH